MESSLNEPVALSGEVPDGVPRMVQVLPFGEHRTGKGTFVLDEEAAAGVVADFRAKENDMVVDYEHQSLGQGEAPAAGWIVRLVNRGRMGIWAVVEWTERAREYLGGREYRYLSPVFLKRAHDGRVMRLINAALTNQPAIDGMVPVVNKEAGPSAPGKSQKEARVMKEVIEALGLKADAEHSEVLGAIVAMRQGAEKAVELEAASARIAQLQEELGRMRATEMVASSIKQGKVTPAQRDWAQGYAEADPEGFNAFVAKAPVVVPGGHAVVVAAGGGAALYDEMQVAVNSLLMVSDEAFAKYAQGVKPLKEVQ